MQAEGDVVRLPVVQEGPLDFATFFADEHRELFRLLCFVSGSRADAADLMQDAFLKLWERWDRVDRIADPRAYLFRVALNGSRRRARTALRAAQRLVPIASSHDPFDEVNLREDVRRMLLSLSPRQRAALALLDLYGLRVPGGCTDHGHPSVDRPRARDAGSCRTPTRRPECLI
jgi:RNA polymerase sigma factor (sigma-70 family)